MSQQMVLWRSSVYVTCIVIACDVAINLCIEVWSSYGRPIGLRPNGERKRTEKERQRGRARRCHITEGVTMCKKSSAKNHWWERFAAPCRTEVRDYAIILHVVGAGGYVRHKCAALLSLVLTRLFSICRNDTSGCGKAPRRSSLTPFCPC